MQSHSFKLRTQWCFLNTQWRMVGCVGTSNLFSLCWCLSQGGRRASAEAMEGFCGGGSAPLGGFESRAEGAPPVGWGFRAVEGGGNAGQANRNLSVRAEQHGASPFQRLPGSQVSLPPGFKMLCSKSRIRAAGLSISEVSHLSSASTGNTQPALISLSENWLCCFYARLPASFTQFTPLLGSLMAPFIMEHTVY